MTTDEAKAVLDGWPEYYERERRAALTAMIAEVERRDAPLDADEGRKIVKALDAFGAEYGKASVYCIAARYIERQAARIAALTGQQGYKP